MGRRNESCAPRHRVWSSLLVTLLVATVIAAAPARSATGTATDPLLNLSHVPGGAVPARLYLPSSSSELPYGGGGRCPTVAQDQAAHVPLSSDGVPMYVWKGSRREHPVRQASSALACIYGDLSDPNRLNRATADAQHLLDHAVNARGALYFPYTFDFAVGGNTRYLSKAPWYSSMAQGQALSLFLALYQVVSDPAAKQKWQDAADKTALSLEIAPARRKPSVTFLDPAGFLWFEEYAGSPIPGGERVLNGHLFSLWGLYDYWRIASQRDYWTTSTTIHSAADLTTTRRFIGAGIVTAEHYIWSKFRDPAGPTYYSIGNHLTSVHYHLVHIQQFLKMQVYTHDARWADYATQFEADNPTVSAAGHIQFRAGAHTLYKLNSAGWVVATRVVRFAHLSGAPTNARERIRGSMPIGDRIAAGAYAGWWAGEVPGRSGTTSVVGVTHSLLRRTITFEAGRSYAGYRLSRNGVWTRGTTQRLTRAMSLRFVELGYRWNMPYVRVLDGVWAGQWVPLGPGVRTDAPWSTVRLAAGRYTAVQLDASGAVTRSRRLVLSRAWSGRFVDQIMLGSRIYVLVLGGPAQIMWLPVVRGVSID